MNRKVLAIVVSSVVTFNTLGPCFAEEVLPVPEETAGYTDDYAEDYIVSDSDGVIETFDDSYTGGNENGAYPEGIILDEQNETAIEGETYIGESSSDVLGDNTQSSDAQDEEVSAEDINQVNGNSAEDITIQTNESGADDMFTQNENAPGAFPSQAEGAADVVGDDQAEDDAGTVEDDLLLSAASSEASINATEVTIYTVGQSGYQNYVTIPEDLQTTFQFQVSGTYYPVRYTLVSGKSAYINADGLAYGTSDWAEGDTVYQAAAGDVTFELTIHVRNYLVEYVNGFLQQWIDENLTDSMTDVEKAEAIVRYAAEEYDYGNSADYVTMYLMKKGDCWASTDMIVTMCGMIGLEAMWRNAAGDSGAGSSHQNALIKIGEDYYIADAGFSGTKPRHYDFRKMNDVWSFIQQADGTLSFYQYNGFDKELVVPETYNGRRVTSVYDRAFARSVNGDLFTSVTLPDSITTIGEKAFEECDALEEVYIPASVTEIGFRAFDWCENLRAIHVDAENPVYKDTDGVLYNKNTRTMEAWPCGKKGALIVEDGTVAIAPYACFQAQGIQGVFLPSGLRTIGEYAFGWASVKKISLPEGLETLGDSCFLEAGITELTVPSSVTRMEDEVTGNLMKLRILTRNLDMSQTHLPYCDLYAVYEGSTADAWLKTQNRNVAYLNDDGTLTLPDNWFRDPDAQTYTGQEITMEYMRSPEAPYWLRENVDYVISGYQNNLHAGEATIQIEGTGIFAGSRIEKKFTILPFPLFNEYYNDSYVIGDGSGEFQYTGEEICPPVTVEGYQQGVDFKAVYSNNVNPGYASVRLEGIGDYTGKSSSYSFFIWKPVLDSDDIRIEDCTYTGREIWPVLKGEDKENCFVTSCENNINAGTATAVITGYYTRKGTIRKTFKIRKAQIQDQYFSVYSTYATGSPVRPSVYSYGLVEGRDYTLSFENNIEVGTARVIITGIGNYTGTKTMTFQILGNSSVQNGYGNNSGSTPLIITTGKTNSPAIQTGGDAADTESEEEMITIAASPKSVRVKVRKSRAAVSWKKMNPSKKTKAVLKRIKRIELQYSTDACFQNAVVSKLIGKNKTSLVLKGLMKNTTYYVRLRYKDEMGGCSNWSIVKKIRIR